MPCFRGFWRLEVQNALVSRVSPRERNERTLFILAERRKLQLESQSGVHFHTQAAMQQTY
eukprot:5804884-Amphidinium_carterae.1